MDYWDHWLCQKMLRTLNHCCWRLQIKYGILKSVHFWPKILFSMVRFNVWKGQNYTQNGCMGHHNRQTHTHSVTLSRIQFIASSPNVYIFSCCTGWIDRPFEIKKEKVSNNSMGCRVRATSTSYMSRVKTAWQSSNSVKPFAYNNTNYCIFFFLLLLFYSIMKTVVAVGIF